MNVLILVLAIIAIFVIIFLLLKRKKPVPVTTTLAPTPTTTLAPVLKCYNLNIPVDILNNGVEDLCIDYRDYNNNYVIHPYYVFDDCGSYQPEAICINICSFVEPTFMFGLHGQHVTIDSIVITVGNCIDGTIECN